VKRTRPAIPNARAAAAAIALIAAALLFFISLARATSPGGENKGALCDWQFTTALANCASFPDAAGKQLLIAGGVSTKGGAQFVQLYDLSGSSPSGNPVASGEAQASPNGNWILRLAPEGIQLSNGALLCNSTNADPTAYSAGSADTTFAVCFR
jgi:hypothetical protein